MLETFQHYLQATLFYRLVILHAGTQNKEPCDLNLRKHLNRISVEMLLILCHNCSNECDLRSVILKMDIIAHTSNSEYLWSRWDKHFHFVNAKFCCREMTSFYVIYVVGYVPWSNETEYFLLFLDNKCTCRYEISGYGTLIKWTLENLLNLKLHSS